MSEGLRSTQQRRRRKVRARARWTRVDALVSGGRAIGLVLVGSWLRRPRPRSKILREEKDERARRERGRGAFLPCASTYLWRVLPFLSAGQGECRSHTAANHKPLHFPMRN